MKLSVQPHEYEFMATVAEVARYHGANRPGQTALSFEGRDTSYGELDRQSNRLANALIAAGVGRGECVAYFGKNSDTYFELLFAAAKAGAVIVPIGWRLAPPEAAYIIDHAAAKAVFVGGE
jgi:long-chain acyl-CoA synthetase